VGVNVGAGRPSACREARLIGQGSLNPGVVLLRLAGQSPERKAEIVGACIAAHGEEMWDCFSVLTSTNLRIRRQIP